MEGSKSPNTCTAVGSLFAVKCIGPATFLSFFLSFFFSFFSLCDFVELSASLSSSFLGVDLLFLGTAVAVLVDDVTADASSFELISSLSMISLVKALVSFDFRCLFGLETPFF